MERAPAWVPSSTWRCEKCGMHLPFENFVTIQGAVALHEANHTITELNATLSQCGERVRELVQANAILSMQAVDFVSNGMSVRVQ